MATIVLSAAGFAAGTALNGTVLGLSTAVIGRAIGATIGHVIDQRIMGRGSEVVETGQVDRFRITGASEGGAIGAVYGRIRVPGQVIWASQFEENVATSGGGSGKGGRRPPQPTVKSYTYSVSMAVALCDGPISGVLRVWADGTLVETTSLNMRVHLGTEDQQPDAKIEAVEGSGAVPAYRGLAYAVFEDLDLTPFGNRVPQFTFEVVRPIPDGIPAQAPDLSQSIEGVAMIPGTGEYSLATTPVTYSNGFGVARPANTNSISGKTDLLTSLDGLEAELPKSKSTVLVVSWFGSDLRCAECTIQPKVEQQEEEGSEMPWSVSGTSRANAGTIVQDGGRPLYGGTPTDRAVIEGIQALRAQGQFVIFYPFILMEQGVGNGLPDPYSGLSDQPVLPWRGRITTSQAPGRPGSPDGTAAAEAEVAQFVGACQPSDFSDGADGIDYTGPAEWSYRRFILHYAHLCAKAGGVDGFCIGSEMRGFTQIRGAGNSFPAVDALIQLAAEVRAILGPSTKISYASDWSEYFGYHPQDGSGDVFFHLDPLWADPNIDFIGIDNYMPLSDWRDGQDHADVGAKSIYNLDYLRGNVAGGEGFDWYYPNQAAREAQIRAPITDGAHGEPWVFRYKDLKSWWQNLHHNRVGGVRQEVPTAWRPQSKPFWFTEYGCAAINKGTNQPNKFLDPKSSESRMPHFSDGRRDDLIQVQYLRATLAHWRDDAANPVSEVYGDRMVDLSRAHVWAWDARPYPYFPGNDTLWSDGDNYLRGHWLNGRASARSLDGLIAELCQAAGVTDYDVSEAYGLVRGFAPANASTARERLQPVMLTYGVDAIEREGVLAFRSRDGLAVADLDPELLAVDPNTDGDLTRARAPDAEVAGRLRLTFVEADGSFETRSEEAIFPDEATQSVAQSSMPLVLTKAEGRAIAERWLSEARIARDSVQFALPLSDLALRAGDVVTLPGPDGVERYRIDRVEQGGHLSVEAVRVEPETYEASDTAEETVRPSPFVAPVPVASLFLDLPLMTGAEDPVAPHVAATGRPWPGSVAVYSAPSGEGFTLNTLLPARAVIGQTVTGLSRAQAGLRDRGAPLRVQLVDGELSSASASDLLNGANLAAIGDGSPGNWELFQFETADLVAERTYDLSNRLRGQAGTDAVMPDFWPTGSFVVLMNGAPGQIDLAESLRGLDRHYRVGPALRAFDDPMYRESVLAFVGIGLRPYAPVHLRLRQQGGDVQVTWVRRTRIDGDNWQSYDVPLGEDSERYLLRVLKDGSERRVEEITSPTYTYTAGAQASDGVSAPFDIDIAQVSGRFGPGPYRRITFHG